jgi:hypothetical protein
MGIMMTDSMMGSCHNKKETNENKRKVGSRRKSFRSAFN